MPDETRAALRLVDQQHDRSPVVCVKTGVRTDRATRVRATALGNPERWEVAVGSTLSALAARALRRPTAQVVLAVDEAPWRRWRRRLGRAAALVACGIGAMVAGAAGAGGGLVVIGVVLVGLGWRSRVRAWRYCWVGLGLNDATGDIVVTRVHPMFAAEARRLYVDSIRPR